MGLMAPGGTQYKQPVEFYKGPGGPVSEVTVTIALPEDAVEMAVGLNAAQADLIKSLGDQSIEECVMRSIDGSSRAWSGRVGGELVAMWGVYPIGDELDIGYPWMYSTERLGRKPKLTLTMAMSVIDHMNIMYKRLFGLVDATHEPNVTFAKHLGFTVGTYPVDPPFLSIERIVQ